MALLKDFRDPPAGYRFAPFWFWNHELKLEELERQIMEMKAAGLGGFIMHARHGLLTAYMGRDWMDAVEHCARVAQREKMWAWLYDEDNWPSGTVGMRLAREHPEFRMSQLLVSDEADLAEGAALEREIAIGDELFCVLAVPVISDELRWGKEKHLTRRVKDGHLKYTAGRQPERVLVFSRTFQRSMFHDTYLDTLSKPAVAWFMRQTHEAYAERLKGLLGRSVKGIFTDEPSMFYGRVGRSIAFTPELPKRFEKEHGIAFTRALPALFGEVGKQTARVRLALHQTLTRMYVEAFFKPIYDWCQRRKIRSMGHPMWEGEFSGQVKSQGDYFAMTEAMHYAGCDTLFERTFGGDDQLNNLLAAKFASSAEHLLEKERAMAESFGVAAGWELTLPTLKWLGDFQAAMGINYFMPHAAYYSLAGFRKFECPPDEFYHVSYWPFYRRFADHLARLSAALHGGEHIAPVALLSPVASMAAAFNPAAGSAKLTEQASDAEPQVRAVQLALERTSETLARHQLDFDLVNEDILSRGRIGSEGELEIRGKGGRVLERFRALVLPGVTALSRATVERLESWAERGLPIVFVEALPHLSPEEGADSNLADRVAALVELPNVVHAPLEGDAWLSELRERVEGDVDVGDVRDIVYLMKDKENRRVVFLANTSRERGYERLTVRLRAAGAAHLMDTTTGELRLLEPVRQEGEWTELELDFPPAGSHLLLFAKRRATQTPAEPRMANIEGGRLAMADSWHFTAEGGNIFPIRRWTFDLSATMNPEIKWSHSRKRFRAEFHAAITPARAMLLGDGLFDTRNFVNALRPQVTVRLNGHELTEWTEGTHYDRLVPETDVTAFIRQGMNELVIENDHCFDAGMNLQSVIYLAGDFTVAGQGEHEVLSIARSTVQTGNWAEQGFPYFSGMGRYEQEFDLPREMAGERLFLEFERVAHSVGVELNGKDAGCLPWQPFSLEVTDFVAPGRNRLVLRVANRMTNLFLLRPDESGLLGKVSLVAKRAID